MSPTDGLSAATTVWCAAFIALSAFQVRDLLFTDAPGVDARLAHGCEGSLNRGTVATETTPGVGSYRANAPHVGDRGWGLGCGRLADVHDSGR